MLGARVLAELGDDRARFADARALKSYAESAPITRASGKKRFVGRRFVKNNLLINAGFLWAFAALTASPGANAHYRRRREHGDWHAAAQRHLLNRFLGQLHHCLKTQQHFDEQQAFAPLLPAPTCPANPTDFIDENNGTSTEPRCRARTQSEGVTGARRPSH